MPGGASGHMVGWLADGPVVPLPALAWSFLWVVVPVVRMCVACERSGFCGRAVGGWLCDGPPAVGVLVDGPATSQLVVRPRCGGGCSVTCGGPCRKPGCRSLRLAPLRKYRFPCPCPQALSACTTPYLAAPDFCWHRQTLVLTCLQRMYNTVVGSAPPGRCLPCSLWESRGSWRVRCRVCPPACSSRSPESRVCCSLNSLSAPLVSLQVCRAVLAGSCRLLWALGPYVTLGRYCSGPRPCGACGPHTPGLPGPLYSEGYLCERPSDVGFLSLQRRGRRAYGCAVRQAPGTPFLGAVPGLIRTTGGPSGRAVGVCMPRGAMRWSVVALFRVYSRDWPCVPAPGSILVRWVAPRCGVDIWASQGGCPNRNAP